jgi:hypothetical protein
VTDPADKEDVKLLMTKLEHLREQNSIEHGSLFTKMTHLGNLMGWLKAAWHRFSILPPPPADIPKTPEKPKDDTQ